MERVKINESDEDTSSCLIFPGYFYAFLNLVFCKVVANGCGENTIHNYEHEHINQAASSSEAIPHALQIKKLVQFYLIVIA
jgi:hypothetical protein